MPAPTPLERRDAGGWLRRGARHFAVPHIGRGVVPVGQRVVEGLAGTSVGSNSANSSRICLPPPSSHLHGRSDVIDRRAAFGDVVRVGEAMQKRDLGEVAHRMPVTYFV